MSAERAVEWRARVWGSVAHFQRRHELRAITGSAVQRTPRRGDLRLVPAPPEAPSRTA